MTLKQFGYLAGGAVVALVFYGTGLPLLIKWTLISISGFTGFALAFLPIQERPLQVWIVSFFKSVFSPTQFLWRKAATPPEFWQKTTSKVRVPTKAPPADKKNLRAYLQSLPGVQSDNPLDQQENASLLKIKQLFLTAQPAVQLQPSVATAPLTLKPTAVVKPPLAKPKPSPPKATIATRSKKAQPFNPIKEQKFVIGAKTRADLPIPAPPTRANILVGMTLTKDEEIIEGAILEVRNSKGIPVRALKTNKLGQFRIATPLEKGTYKIETEKEGYQFDIIKFEAKGKVILPIEIKAR